MSGTCVKLPPECVEFVCLDMKGGFELDCRLLFLGSNLMPLVGAYGKAASYFAATSDRAELLGKLRGSVEIQKYYEATEVDGQVRLLMKDSTFRRAGPTEGLKFCIRVASGGRVETYPVPLSRFRALGMLMPMLLGRHTSEKIRQALAENLSKDERGWALELFAWLASEGYMVSTSDAGEGGRTGAPRPAVTLISHSSLLFESRRSAVITDPILYKRLGSPPAAFEILRTRIGAICCTHAHWDHCNLQTLLWIDKSLPILIPRAIRPSAFNPPIASVLQSLGFQDIREVNPWEPVQIEDIEIVPAPFHGEEDEPGAEIDHYTYVLRSGGFTVYGGVDSFRDSAGDMRPVLKRVAQHYRPDVCFLPVSNMTYQYRHGGVNAFCRLMDQSLINRSFQYTASPEDAAEWAALLDAKAYVPYATFTFSARRISPEVATFRRALRACRLSSRLFPLGPLDWLTAADLENRRRATARRLILEARAVALGALGRVSRSVRASWHFASLAFSRRSTQSPVRDVSS